MANQPKTMQELPDQVIDWLNDLAGFEFNEQFLKKFGLPAEKDIDLINLVTDIVLGQTALADLPQELETRLGLPADKSQAAAVELAGNRLLPISGVVGNVAEQIQTWGGDLSAFQGEGKVVLPKLTAESFVQGALKDLGLTMEDKVLQHRLELILVSYAKGVRDQSEAIGTLTRAQKVGGLDMAKDDAEALLEEIDKKLAFVNLSFREEGVEGVDGVEQKKKPAKTMQDVKPPVKKVENKKTKVVNDQKQVGKPKTQVKDTKKDREEIKQMLATLETDRNKTKELLAQLEKKAKSKKRPKRDKELEGMLATLEADRNKTKELLAKMKKQADQKKDAAKAAKKDLRVEKEAMARNDGAPKAALKAKTTKKSERRNPETVTEKKKEKKKVDTSILKGRPGADTFGPEDEEEIKRIASVKAKALAGAADPAQALVREIIGTAKLKFPNDEVKKRFIKAVDSRIRDIRDIYEVRGQLESPVDKGGVGLSGAKLAETVQVIDRLVKDYHAKLETEATKKKQETMKQKREAEAKAQAAAKARQEQLMAKRYAEITGRAPSEAVTGSVTRSTAAMSAEETMARQEQQIDTQKVKQAVMNGQGIPAKSVKMSAQSIQATGAKPQVQDVRFTRRLAGPVEELRNMGVVEFRRLSTDPQEAIDKIMDKITLVEDQGYDQKIAAIKAWRSSPINQEYLALTREALLTGKKVSDLIKEKGEGGLTQAEIEAIMKLNGQLHL